MYIPRHTNTYDSDNDERHTNTRRGYSNRSNDPIPQIVSKRTKFILEGLLYTELNQFFLSELSEDGYAGVELRQTPIRYEAIIRSTRPKNILGDKGRRIRTLQQVVTKRFNFPEGVVELFVERVLHSGLSAIAQAISLEYKIKGGLEIRRAACGVVRFIMDNEAVGCEVIVSGKLKGERARAAKFAEGTLIHSGHGTQTYIDQAIRHCCLRVGIFGCRVKIHLPHDPTGKKGPKNPRPDQITIREPPPPLCLPLTYTYTRFRPLPPGWVPPKQVKETEGKKNTKTSKKKNKKERKE